MRKEKETWGSINKRLPQRGGPRVGRNERTETTILTKKSNKNFLRAVLDLGVRPSALAAVQLSVVRAKAPVCFALFPLWVSLRVSGGQTPSGAGKGRFS